MNKQHTTHPRNSRGHQQTCHIPGNDTTLRCGGRGQGRAKIYRISSGVEKWLDYDKIAPILKVVPARGPPVIVPRRPPAACSGWGGGLTAVGSAQDVGSNG